MIRDDEVTMPDDGFLISCVCTECSADICPCIQATDITQIGKKAGVSVYTDDVGLLRGQSNIELIKFRYRVDSHPT